MTKEQLAKQLKGGKISQAEYDLKLKEWEATQAKVKAHVETSKEDDRVIIKDEDDRVVHSIEPETKQQLVDQQRQSIQDARRAISKGKNPAVVKAVRDELQRLKKDLASSQGSIEICEAKLEQTLFDQEVYLSEAGEADVRAATALGCVKQLLGQLRHGVDVWLTEEQRGEFKLLSDRWDEFVQEHPEVARSLTQIASEHGTCDSLSTHFSVKGGDRDVVIKSAWRASAEVMEVPIKALARAYSDWDISDAPVLDAPPVVKELATAS